jgi:hypothetical protein
MRRFTSGNADSWINRPMRDEIRTFISRSRPAEQVTANLREESALGEEGVLAPEE